MINYQEEQQSSKVYKQLYLDGITALIKKNQGIAEECRDEYIKDVFTNRDKYIADFKKMLGWPLWGYTPEGLPECSFEQLSEEETHTIFRVKVEILDGLFMTGLFFKAKGNGKKPFVVVQHGGLGTPELISGVYGKTANYNDILTRVICHDTHAFAPQLLLWADDYNVEFDRKEIDAQLKRLGSSITAIEVFGITRIIDYFEAQPYVLSVGMVGMSYGGFYTLFTSAIDTRIKSAISCSFFNTRDAISWSDWTWFNAAKQFDDAEIACLVYPRRLCLEIGDKDELFDAERGIKSFERLKKLCRNVGTDWVRLIVFEGTHEFCRDDEPIQKLIDDLKNL